MQKTIPVEEAVGMVLPHDITEIRTPSVQADDDSGDTGGKQDSFKGPAFKKGHVIRLEDIPHLKRLGKEHIYVLRLGPGDIHENEAARQLAGALAGSGVVVSGEPSEGKLNITAGIDGLLKIDTHALYQINFLGDVICSTLHTNIMVNRGDHVAATRLIPLVGKRDVVDRATDIAGQSGGVIRVLPLKKARAGLVITGNEVFHGRIKDKFEPVLRKKLSAIGSEVIQVSIAPDEVDVIADKIKDCLDAGADLIVTSGGMSVDPDDVTRFGIKAAGAVDIVYGTPVLPGAMFLVGYIGKVPVLGLPACGMFHKITVFDLVLPRILAGEKIRRKEFAELGHGGLCRNCKKCMFPVCGFGK